MSVVAGSTGYSGRVNTFFGDNDERIPPREIFLHLDTNTCLHGFDGTGYELGITEGIAEGNCRTVGTQPTAAQVFLSRYDPERVEP